ICCAARSSTAQPCDRSLNTFIRLGLGAVLRASVRRHRRTLRGCLWPYVGWIGARAAAPSFAAERLSPSARERVPNKPRDLQARRSVTHAFGPDVHLAVASDGLPGVVRRYTSFDAAAQEAGMSRIYGGNHYPFDNTAPTGPAGRAARVGWGVSRRDAK